MVRGLNGGHLLYLAIAGCSSNDLFGEARAEGIALDRVRVRVWGDFGGDAPVSTEVEGTGVRLGAVRVRSSR